jgi:peptidoglycan/xylan/chitin deacetylase (PgdA/CDA1 family)
LIYKSILELLYFIIRFTGLGNLLRLLFAKNKLTIIVYHNPSVDILEKHLGFLIKKYNPITISDLNSLILNNSWNSLPDYSLLITIDDGWKENYQLLDIFKKFNVRPIIFLTSHLLNTNRHFWWTVIKSAKEVDSLKKLSNTDRLDLLLAKYNFCQTKEYCQERHALSNSEILEMKEFVDFGLHASFHPILTRCTLEEKRFEILEGKKRIESILGQKIHSFAYPNGDYDAETVSILRNNGFKFARTTDVGRNTCKTDLLRLKISGVSDTGSINKIVTELTGLPLYVQYLLDGSFSGGKGIKFKN